MKFYLYNSHAYYRRYTSPPFFCTIYMNVK